jgi:hypothetical protein
MKSLNPRGNRVDRFGLCRLGSGCSDYAIKRGPQGLQSMNPTL